VAGAGKSSTLLEIARRHGQGQILYAVFNRSVQRDQKKKYFDAGLFNVHVTTIDALAYHATANVHGGPQVEVYHLSHVDVECVRESDEALEALRATIDAFSVSVERAITAVHVPYLSHKRGLRELIIRVAPIVWGAFAAGERPLTSILHTKLYQLTVASQDARFDLVLIDEAHDCTPAQFDALINLPQTAIVIAYDERQSINGWRGAMNPQELVAVRARLPAKTFNLPLTTSFRYGQGVAACATKIFSLYPPSTNDIGHTHVVRGNPKKRSDVVPYDNTAACISGLLDNNKRVALIARTHVHLVAVAIELLRYDGTKKNSIVFHTGGAFAHINADVGYEAILDMCSLATRRSSADAVSESSFSVLAHLSRSRSPIDELRVIAKSNNVATDDTDWRAALLLLDTYGPVELERLANLLASCVRNDTPNGTATFITIHASKGLSWPWVVVADVWPRSLPEDNECAIRECYVAMTRPEMGLALPRHLHRILTSY
jgi:hypothetical protein